MTREKPYSFWPSEAEKYGIEKAVILYNLRHWLSVNKAAAKPMHFHDNMWWTYNTAKAFEKLMPFFNRRSISRWMNELEAAGVVKSGVFNAAGYDRTKWYTIPSEFSESAIGQNGQANCQNDQCIGQNDSPIPVVNPVVKPDENLIAPSTDGACSECVGLGYHGLPEDKCNHCTGTGKEPSPSKAGSESKPKRKTKAEKLIEKVKSMNMALFNSVSDEMLLEWARLRARKNASDSDRALSAIHETLRVLWSAGIHPEQALAKQCDRGWTTIEAEWILKERQQNPNDWQTQSGWSAGLENEIYRGDK